MAITAAAVSGARLAATTTTAGFHRNTDSPTYGSWYSFGNQANSAGFPGTGSPTEAYGALVIYQRYGTNNGANAPVTKTTQGGYLITNYFGPTADDSMEGFSTFVGAKDTTVAYTQARPVTSFEAISQVEGANQVAGSSAYMLGVGSRINVLGTATVENAYGFKASTNTSGGPPYGTMGRYIGFYQPVASGATTAFGVYTVDQITSETGLSLGRSAYSGSLSSRLSGNTDGSASMILINLPTSTDVAGTLTGIRVNAGTGQVRRLQEWWGPGAATATSYVDNSGALNTRSTFSIRDASLGPLFTLTTTGPQWVASSLTQLTVGAGGAAAAPPSQPARYLRVLDPSGTTLVIPAYNA